jgi:hypothetical protein
MDVLKKAKDKYKLGTSVIDMSVVLTNKAMDLVNNKVLSNAEKVNKELSSGNIDKAKKLGNVYVDMLKNYMTLVSTMNLLVADSHSANYERKMILRKLLRSIESKTDNSEYILSKVISFEKHVSSAAQHISTLSLAIKPISGGAEKSEDKPDAPVKDLSGVAGILMSMGKKVEMALAEIKLVNKEVLKLVTKKGSFENMRTDEFDSLQSASRNKLVKGGVEVNNKKRQSGKVKIVGGAENDDEFYIGGANLAQDLEVKATWVESYKLDKLAMRDNPGYAKLMDKKMLDVFKVGSAEELKRVAELGDDDYIEKVTDDCELDGLLQKQIDAIMNGGKLQRLLEYYIKHRNKYAPSKSGLTSETFVMGETAPPEFTFTALSLRDDYINLNLSLTDDSSTDEKLQYIVDFVNIVMKALNKVDIQAVVNKTKVHFTRINDIKTTDQLDDTMDELDNIMKRIESHSEFLVERKRLKVEILKHADDVIENEGMFVKPTKSIKGTNEIGELADHLLEKQINFRHILGGVEQTCNDQANTLAKLIGSIDSLISPDNKEPCVCKSIDFVVALTYIEVLPKLLKKRFMGRAGSEKFKRLEEHRAYLADKAKLPMLYRKKLDTDAIRSIAAQLLETSD